MRKLLTVMAMLAICVFMYGCDGSKMEDTPAADVTLPSMETIYASETVMVLEPGLNQPTD